MMNMDSLFEAIEHGGDEDVTDLINAAGALDAMIAASNDYASYDQLYDLVTDNAMGSIIRVDDAYGDGAAHEVFLHCTTLYANEVREHRKRKLREMRTMMAGAEAIRKLA